MDVQGFAPGGSGALVELRPPAADADDDFDGRYCYECGHAPVVELTFRRVVGYVLFRRTVVSGGLFCRGCARATFRDYQNQTLLKGWWGVLAAPANIRCLLANARQARRARGLTAPEPTPLRDHAVRDRPLAAGRPVLMRAGASVSVLVLLSVVLLASVLVDQIQAGRAVYGSPFVAARDLVLVGTADVALRAPRAPEMPEHVSPSAGGRVLVIPPRRPPVPPPPTPAVAAAGGVVACGIDGVTVEVLGFSSDEVTDEDPSTGATTVNTDVEIDGIVTNATSRTVEGVGIEITIYDSTGPVARGSPTSPSLARIEPGAQAEWSFRSSLEKTDLTDATARITRWRWPGRSC